MTSRFDRLATPLPGLSVLIPRLLGDARGSLERLYCESELAEMLAGRRIVQVNRTVTRQKGTVRGLHFQYPPHAETKIVTCLRGAVFDVAVDLRAGSLSQFAWHGRRLDPTNREMMVIPEGFAHGFQTLTDDCELLYFHTAPYVPGSEGGLNACDPRIGIAWPEPLTLRSDRDAALPLSGEGFGGILA